MCKKKEKCKTLFHQLFEGKIDEDPSLPAHVIYELNAYYARVLFLSSPIVCISTENRVEIRSTFLKQASRKHRMEFDETLFPRSEKNKIRRIFNNNSARINTKERKTSDFFSFSRTTTTTTTRRGGLVELCGYTHQPRSNNRARGPRDASSSLEGLTP